MDFEKIWESVKQFFSENVTMKTAIIVGAVLLLLLILNIMRTKKTSGNYRNDFIKRHPGKRLGGRGGFWYKCAACGKWCGRPGREGANIPDDMKMEVDHVRPWNKGGSDAVWNLQALCRPCNRSKSNGHSFKDTLKNTKNCIFHPVDSFIAAPIRKAGRNNKVLKGIGLTKRK